MWKFLIFVGILIHGNAASVRIANGTDAEEGEFPFIVSLRYELGHVCGASIINQRYALTAAHCVCIGNEPRDVSPFSIQYGSVKIDNTTERSIQVSKAYCNTYGTDYHNDVAVIELKADIPPDYNWKPTNLSKDFDTTQSKKGIIIGWGLVSENESLPVTLQKLEVNIYPDKTCEELYGSEKSICIWASVGGACRGDSGGALLAEGQQVGVTSMSTYPCGKTPSIYTRVTYFYDWIKQHSTL